MVKKISNIDLKNFVEASYKTKGEAQNINGYTLDPSLSTRRNKVYVNNETGQVVHTIAGTDNFKDWSNNLLIPLGLHPLTNRYKNSEEIQRQANEKYGKENVNLITHSQSGNIAETLANRNLVGGYNTTLNPAIIGSHNMNLDVVKSIFDPVSLLTRTNANDTLIFPTSMNPFIEHSTKILGSGLHKNIQSILFKRPEWTLAKCKTWLKKHGYKTSVDTKPNHYRFRQLEPETFKKYITKSIGNDIEFIIGLKTNQVNKTMPRQFYETESDSESDEKPTNMKSKVREQDLIDRMTHISHDIHAHHQTHGGKSDVIKAYKVMGEGIKHSLGKRMSGCGQKGSNSGNNNVDKFNDWFKAIGQKFLPLNKNLQPIKQAGTQSAVDQINYNTLTPQEKLQEGIDMMQQEGPQTSNALRRMFSSSQTPSNPVTATPVSSSVKPSHSPDFNSMYQPQIPQIPSVNQSSDYYNPEPSYYQQSSYSNQPSSYERSWHTGSGSGLSGNGTKSSNVLKRSLTQNAVDVTNASTARAIKGISGNGTKSSNVLKRSLTQNAVDVANASTARAIKGISGNGTKSSNVLKRSLTQNAVDIVNAATARAIKGISGGRIRGRGNGVTDSFDYYGNDAVEDRKNKRSNDKYGVFKGKGVIDSDEQAYRLIQEEELRQQAKEKRKHDKERKQRDPLCLGLGLKKGSPEMKAKMAKIRAMRGKGLSDQDKANAQAQADMAAASHRADKQEDKENHQQKVKNDQWNVFK